MRHKKGPKQTPPLGIEREYISKLHRILENTKNILENNVLNRLPEFLQGREILTKMDSPEEIETGFSRSVAATNEAISTALEELTFEIGSKVSKWNKKAVEKVLKRKFGIVFYEKNIWLSDMLRIFATNNANLIRSNNLQFISNVEEIVYRGMNAGTRHEVIRKEILGRNKTELGRNSAFRNAKHRASVIARDQVNKLNGDLTHLRQERVGIKKFIWRTAGDFRVRPLHQELNGKTFSWKKGAVDGLLPGQDIMCRCYADPIFDD